MAERSGSALAPAKDGEVRKRLVAELSKLSSAPLRIVVGPAGYGKTTLLRRLAALAADEPWTTPVWYSASAAEVSPPALVQKLARAFGPALGSGGGRITQLDTMLHRLRNADGDFTIFVDNADRLAGRPSAEALTSLLNQTPSNVHFVVASRSLAVPAISRLDAIAPICRINHDDLRLRAWETEALFREVYRRPLSAEAAATLCAEVEGWPAALHTFHMDTVLLSDPDRLKVADQPLWRSPQTREYLARAVLDPLPADVRDFMVRASALGVLAGGLCDPLLGRSDSAHLLRKLADNQILTWPCERGESHYRFHLLLQQHLEATLAEHLGPQRTRRWYAQAAVQLVRLDQWPEAYRAYAHGENWVAGGEILHHRRADHDHLSDASVLPRALLDRDPWVLLATARRLRADGRLAAAVGAYDQARDAFVEPRMRWHCVAERAAIAHWLSPAERAVQDPDYAGDWPAADLSGQLCQAVHGGPSRLRVHATAAADAGWSLARGLAAALEGYRGPAARMLQRAVTSPNPFTSLASRLGLAALSASANRPEGSSTVCTALALEAETSGWPWLARLATAARALTEPNGCADAIAVRDECLLIGDRWGALLAGLLLSAGTMRAGGDAEPLLRGAIELARTLGATVVELWLRVLLVDELDRTGDPTVEHERRLLYDDATATRVGRAISHGPGFAATIRSTTPSTDSTWTGSSQQIRSAVGAPGTVTIRCLGAFQFVIGHTHLSLSSVRPQARTILRILASHTRGGIHEEKLIDAVWPDVPPAAVRHRLHVAVSSLRKLLRHEAGEEVDIARRGDIYTLLLPRGSEVDILAFEDAVALWRANGGLAAGDDDAVAWGYRVLRLYGGELLAEEGSAEWALVERDRLRTAASEVATALAGWEVRTGNIDAAIAVCQRGLQIDELNDQLWHLLADAQQRTGNQAAARRALRTYQDLFNDPQGAT